MKVDTYMYPDINIPALLMMRFEDYKPAVDFNMFPRVDIRAVPDEENRLNGWTWKATVKGRDGGPLSGRTVCLKDTICLAGVPCLFGTNAIKNFIRTFFVFSALFDVFTLPQLLSMRQSLLVFWRPEAQSWERRVVRTCRSELDPLPRQLGLFTTHTHSVSALVAAVQVAAF